jgi:hypothetical protein
VYIIRPYFNNTVSGAKSIRVIGSIIFSFQDVRPNIDLAFPIKIEGTTCVGEISLDRLTEGGYYSDYVSDVNNRAHNLKPFAINNEDIVGTNVKLIKQYMHEESFWKDKQIIDCFSDKCDPEEFSKYKIWLSIEGWGCASDTTRALMSGCAVIYYRRTSPWFDKYLKNRENCIIITVGDINNLIMTIKEMLNNKEFTESIAKSGKELANIIFQPDFYKNNILEQMSINVKSI